ncbi:hypothetical protein HETIRDRAFT_482248 [Heterobasidion irregulare TC 32-1]|uniref:DUF300-domain-containing protein n=1 Tax=Heterobasidion irregulare (strain TC 32-1) TaxID=747525 RepID=W4JPQ9_HETIT|nr:uncharacterized protein HETIRDRAFT_482248 [Heterobasidion irregulare TC 32-1]ETW75518.1 hypothetical protein HETIRDRAFT_482248 [Heterobasidion irregulare TC 32-1]
MVIRIMLMVPLYGISSLISLFSLEAAFVIDVIRDIYEAFVIYCFFQLLLAYLGGERSLIILVHGRPPKAPPFPMNIFQRELDVSDPYTFLFLKRGILQYVQVKPILAVATLILKAAGKFNEGDLRADSGYLYISIIYNMSICLSLYCLAMFWLSISEDLKPFRPMPKFLCVKGILFFSFWQSIGISILVAMGAIKQLGPYLDKEHISLGLTDTMICLEMPLFAIAHMFAFAHTDYIDKHLSYVGRMPMFYATRDAFGFKDVVEDSKTTLRGEGMGYREFEPSEGYMHQGLGRERRIRAGLRYSKGGKGKYWLPLPVGSAGSSGPVGRGINAIQRMTRREDEEVHAPLLAGDIEDVVHDADDLRDDDEGEAATGLGLPFGDLNEEDERLFQSCKQYFFGDYNYPCIDASSESARIQMWDEEERILRNERSAWFSSYGERRRADSGKHGPTYGAGASHQVDRSIIDMEAERLPAGDAAGVRLEWTKVSKKSSSSQSTSVSASPSKLSRPGSSSRHQSLSLPPSSNNSPSINNRALAHVPGEARRPDAVDLVIEDKSAGEAGMTRERRHGEPAMRGAGVMKVYRRKYLPGEEDAEVESEAQVQAEGGDLEDLAQAVTETELREEDKDGSADGLLEDITIARAETPPSHARVSVVLNRYGIPEEDNPWA